MTKSELIKLLGNENGVNECFTRVRKIMPSLAEYRNTSDYDTDLYLDEVLAICKEMKMNAVQLELVKENYQQRDVRFVSKKSKYIDGTEKFLKAYNRNKYQVKTCTNCIYIQGRQMEGTHVIRPFCSFYNNYIHNMRVMKYGKMVMANIFLDSCPSFNRGEPRLFLRSEYFTK